MELNDIQGLVVRAHQELPQTGYAILEIKNAVAAREWLQGIVPRITHGLEKNLDCRVQLAFTYPGLETLGATEFVKSGFAVEFIQGMGTEFRSRILGDYGDSAPSNWQWGGPDTPPVHLVLMCFSSDKESLHNSLENLLPESSGLHTLSILYSELNPKNKEHFGFRDGISQPNIAGLNREGMEENKVATGEFVLGYLNGYDQLPESPKVDSKMDPHGILPLAKDEETGEMTLRDFGKNGTYLVFRQLIQDVHLFWNQIARSIQSEQGEAAPPACIHLASKMVGRWPNGTPMAASPEKEQADNLDHNSFLYAEQDPKGLGCPIGAHVRRSNPRDALPDNKPEKAVKISNRHRILRRGRNFGPPLAPTFEPIDLLAAPQDGQERGLNFICMNANISRQFEFTQHTWSNNKKFGGLYNDPDPVLGIKGSKRSVEDHDFTIQAEPVRRKVQHLQRPVHVIGGAYFFLPGLKALRFLSQFNSAEDV